MTLVAQIATDGRRRTARPGADDNPPRHRVTLGSHLFEDRLGNIVVAAPVRGALGESELVHIVAARLLGEALRSRINFARAVDEMAATAVEFDSGDFFGRRGFRHDGNELKAEQPGEIGFRNCR